MGIMKKMLKRSKNKSGGKHDAQVDNLREKATAPKGRHNQPRGNAESGAKAKRSSPQRNYSTDLEF
jgi:hypothetical protein